MLLIDRPIISNTYPNLQCIEVEKDSVYFYGKSPEDRANISELQYTDDSSKLTKITKHAKRHFWLNDVCTCHGLLPSHSA